MTVGSGGWTNAPTVAFSHEALFFTAAKRIRSLRDRLGSTARSVQFVATDDTSENPATLIPLWKQFAESLHPAQGLRGVTEPVRSGMPEPLMIESQIHESLLNRAFADETSFWLLCTYDESMGREVLDEARRSHQYVSNASERSSLSDEFEEVGDSDLFDSEAPWEPPTDAQRLDVDLATISSARRALYEFAYAFGMTESAAQDCALAGHEVISNSLRHGGGEAHLSMWGEGENLICQVTDTGHFDSLLAGRTRPEEKSRTGRGLWIANQLCDLVQVRSLRQGTVVRLHMHCRCQQS